MKKLTLGLLIVLTMTHCTSKTESVSGSIINDEHIGTALERLTEKHPQADREMAEKGLRHAASLWWAEDGAAEDFIAYCSENFLADAVAKEQSFAQLSKHFEPIWGHFNKMSLHLQEPLHLKSKEVLPIDAACTKINAAAHRQHDFNANSSGCYVSINMTY